jgi:iron complex outermembrane receptor protein
LLELGSYLQEQFWINSQWALCVGSQLNYVQRTSTDNWPTGPDNSDSQSWWGASPKAGILYQPVKEVQFYTDFSRSFEPPTFGELVEASNGQVGLVQLDAQTGSTIEIGTRGRFEHLTWDFCYYYSWLQNELLAYEIAPGLTQTVNAGNTRHQGVEFAANWDVFYNIFTREKAGEKTLDAGISSEKPDFDRLLLRVNYLWNNFAYADDAVYGNNLLPGIPEHYLRAELVYEHPCGFTSGRILSMCRWATASTRQARFSRTATRFWSENRMAFAQGLFRLLRGAQHRGHHLHGHNGRDCECKRHGCRPVFAG